MTTINRMNFKDSTSFFGCNRDCKDLEIAVSIKFKCSHPPQAYTFINECVEGQDNFEIRFNSNKEECQILIFPEEIDLNPSIEEVEELEELEEIEDDEWEALSELL